MRTRLVSSGTLGVLSLLLSAGGVSAQVRLLTLAPRPGDSTLQVMGISGDGLTVVGSSSGATTLAAVRWNSVTGAITTIPYAPLPGRGFSQAAVTNSNGTIFGVGAISNSTFQSQAVRVSLPGTQNNLPLAPGGNFSYVTGMSSDGSVLTGWAGINADGSQQRMYRWTLAGGFQVLPIPAGTSGNNNTDLRTTRSVSGDGQVVLGRSNDGIGYTYNQSTGASTILPRFARPSGDLLGSSPLSISSDASTIVGRAGFEDAVNSVNMPVRWISTGIEALVTPAFAGSNDLSADAVSADGLTIVINNLSGNSLGALIWRAGTLTPLLTLAQQNGLNVSAYSRLEVIGISDDGNTFTGRGSLLAGGSVSYVLSIPTPGATALLGLTGLRAARRRRA
ncbi:hypothetical protein BH11PLA1_BH11PLA1_13870 [soil metagenome]